MNTHTVKDGDLVLLIGNDHKECLIMVATGQELQTHHGVVKHAAIIGQPWGTTVRTHLDYAYIVLSPSLEQLVRSVKRTTQIIYPKEIGYLLMKMNIGPGTRILEAGTGSGGMTLALARMVQPHGHVFTYEIRPETQRLAQKNLARVGYSDYVTFKVRDIEEGFDEQNLDAVFLDVREPWYYLKQAHKALKGGGFFGALLPTTNQVSALLRHLPMNAFGFIEVDELILRPYKAVAERLRPVDRIVAHTGYLIFARALLPEERKPAVVEPEGVDESFPTTVNSEGQE